MLKVASFWHRLPLIGRLLVTASFALLVAGTAMLVVSVRQEAEESRIDLDLDLSRRLQLLPSLLTEHVVLGDYATIQRLLDQYVTNPRVSVAVFSSSHRDVLYSVAHADVPAIPEWFADTFGFIDVAEGVPLTVGGRQYGEVRIQLTANLNAYRAWVHLQNHLAILLLAILMDFFGIWWVLRNGLTPLKKLEVGANAVASGHLDVRIASAGSPDLRNVVDAFNHMVTGVRVAQDSLRESEQAALKQTRRLGEVIWGTNIGIWEWNIQTGETTFNERWADIVGYTLAELEPVSIKTWEKLVHPEDGKRSEALLQRCFAREAEFYECEVRMRHKNGDWVWVLDRGRVVEWTEDGLPLRMSGTHQEITARKLLEDKWQLERDFNSGILDTARSIIMVIDREGRIVRLNQEAQRFTGYSQQEASQQPFFWVNFLLPEQREQVKGVFGKLMEGNVVERYENFWVRRDGSQALFDWSNALLRNAAGEIEYLITVGIDISERKAFEQQLNESLRYNRGLIEASLDPLVTISKDGRIMDVNQAAIEITGISREDLIGSAFSDYFTAPEKAEEGYRQTFVDGRISDYPLSIRRSDGNVTEVLYSASTFLDEQGEVAGVFAAARDITKLKETVARIEHMALFDALTDLPNRTMLHDRLHQALAAAKREKTSLALMFIDLDKFKPVNDTYGHHIGDKLLIQVAQRMLGCIRESDTVARLGGDEFIVLLPNLEREQDAMVVAEKILAALREPFQVDAATLEISSSIGIAIYPKHGQDWDTLSRYADAAMYRAKEDGRDTAVLA